MPDEAPGLRRRSNKDGTTAYYWAARAIVRDPKGFEPPTVRLHHDTHEGRAARCRQLTAELREWLANKDPQPRGYDGTIGSLIRVYQTADDSPYRDIRHRSRNDYDYSLGILESVVGEVEVAAINRADIVRWYRGFRAPATEGGPERLRRAHGAMKMLRVIAAYGKGMRFAGCRDLRDILSDMRFELPRARAVAIDYAQAATVVEHAIEAGKLSIAIAQALQFECALRQVDVIGYWEPADGATTGILDRGSLWQGGVTWADISTDYVLTKQSTKTGARGEWDLAQLPLVMGVLALVPPERRIGPMVVREKTGLPYRANKFQCEWRAIARAAGIPDDVQNRDSRAGGITEGEQAGADPRDLQRLATHSDIKTTARYIRSTTRKATDKVAELRVSNRRRAAQTRAALLH